jgi:Tfp pilus assembly major pilin PilA
MLKHRQAIAGVTLLEIMLVLAIASMVIIMSVRYYQSASLNQKINAAVDGVTGIVAAAESYLASTGSNGALSGISSGQLIAYLPNGVMPSSPWGGALTIGSGSTNGYIITIPNVPGTGCTALSSLLQQNSKLTASGCVAEGSAGALTVTVTE